MVKVRKFTSGLSVCISSLALLMHVLYLAASHWCISRSYGHPLVLSSQETGVNRVGGSEWRMDGVIEGWRQYLDLICAITLETAGLMLGCQYCKSLTLTYELSSYFRRTAASKCIL